MIYAREYDELKHLLASPKGQPVKLELAPERMPIGAGPCLLVCQVNQNLEPEDILPGQTHPYRTVGRATAVIQVKPGELAEDLKRQYGLIPRHRPNKRPGG